MSPDDAHELLSIALPPLMAQQDAQAESVLVFDCPACGSRSAVLLDAADYLFQELRGERGNIYQQVHQLAAHYHWSETEILALPRPKRQRKPRHRARRLHRRAIFLATSLKRAPSNPESRRCEPCPTPMLPRRQQ